MGYVRYMQSRLWELVFMIVASSALAYTACSVFYATQPIQSAPWAIALVCAGLSIVLESATYTKTTAIWGGVAFAVAAVAAMGICVAASPYELPLEDAEGNYAYLVIVLVASTAATFLLSRTKIGSVVLLVGGAYLCGVVEYLYRYGHVVALCLFLLGAVGLLVCCGYRRALQASDEGSVAFTPVALASLGVGAAALLVSAGIFFAFVAPLNPPGVEMKLFVENMRVEEIYIMGTGSSTADETGEGGSLYGDDNQVAGEEASAEWYETHQEGSNSQLGMNDNQQGDQGTTSMLRNPSVVALLVIALLIALIVLAILLKKLLRKRRFNRMTAGSNEQSAINLYLFFLDRMEKLKMIRPATASLSEYVSDSSDVFRAFEGSGVADAKPAFAALTDVYERAVYGKEPVSADELASFKDYYGSLYGNIRKRMGALRYAFRYFFL